ncbi:PQ loop repeat-domain-containing protein [Calycina marina]|uniref:PQ loop repeat-domain-containing protein n=1 Tax=Calycina marina TaxID=1763456 RepID=A0A9P7YWT2_9HELO|nr:PQ loop repeat-domain-containing protein [Calycina marina]
MVPPSQNLNLDIAAISGILGSVSISCWIVVFSPQIIENFRRGSADGLSLQFIVVWLAGDVFNILGAVLQGVLPTMIILAIYYTIADIVLLLQCFYYRGFTWKDEVVPPYKPIAQIGEANEQSGLLSPDVSQRRPSTLSGTAHHLSPVVPLIDAPRPSDSPAIVNSKSTTCLQAIIFNLFTVVIVCLAGVLGWYLSNRSQGGNHHSKHPSSTEDELEFSLWGQIFGWFCAILYLGSRVPQLLLNYRRRSTEGISVLFVLFACIGNLTYVLSIFAYEAHCSGKHGRCAKEEAARLYGRYILVNASWLAGSLGTLFLDFAISAQFYIYREKISDTLVDEDNHENARDHRLLLDRGD